MANSCAASTFQFSSVFLSVEEVESPRLLSSLASTVMYPLRSVYVVVSELKIAAGVVLYYPCLKPPITASALGLRSMGTCAKSYVAKQSKRLSRGICTHFAA